MTPVKRPILPTRTPKSSRRSTPSPSENIRRLVPAASVLMQRSTPAETAPWLWADNPKGVDPSERPPRQTELAKERTRAYSKTLSSIASQPEASARGGKRSYSLAYASGYDRFETRSNQIFRRRVRSGRKNVLSRLCNTAVFPRLATQPSRYTARLFSGGTSGCLVFT